MNPPDDLNDLLRNMPPDSGSIKFDFPNMSREDQDYLQNLLRMIRDGKPYMVAVATEGNIKYIMGGMSREEQMLFLAEINLQRAKRLNGKQD